MSDLSSPAPPQLPRHKLSLEGFHRLGQAGVLDEDSRVELFRGELIDMAPIGSMHAGVVAQLNLLLSRGVRDGIVQVQNPVTIGDESDESADLCVSGRVRTCYKHPLPPTAQDVCS